LWEQGFWGAGSLSRSEPQWLDQEKRKRGIKASLTSEEVTRERRQARRQFKLERARLEREAIEAQRQAEASGDSAVRIDPNNTTGQPTAVPANSSPEAEGETPRLSANGAALADVDSAVSRSAHDDLDDSSLLHEELASVEIEDQEHLQLTFEEAFFLTYALGALEISGNTLGLPSLCLFRLFSIYSEFPLSETAERHVQDLYRLLEANTSIPLTVAEPFVLAPDNPFLLKYITFHHFRSLGWVVRPGIKFAVDYLLYNRGPAFTHAEFAIMIIPSYSHTYWNDPSNEQTQKESKDWWWLHRINRVQTQVHKSLMLVYIEIPPPWDKGYEKEGYQLEIATVLKKYKVREFILKRWSPNRQRG
jgi:tRNA-splicing endonuclease subunit Sen2